MEDSITLLYNRIITYPELCKIARFHGMGIFYRRFHTCGVRWSFCGISVEQQLFGGGRYCAIGLKTKIDDLF